MSEPSIVPVALFAYNRPVHLERTLESLRENGISKIFAFSDGAKNEHDEKAVADVRQVLNMVRWADIRVVERQQNLGLGDSITSGISQVLRQHDRIIVAEDDILFRPGAYDFVCRALDHYANSDPRVMSVSMSNYAPLVGANCDVGFFSQRFICSGWATYRSAWSEFENQNVAALYRKCKLAKLDVSGWGNDLIWQVRNARKRNLWAVGYILTHILNDAYSFIPTSSLTANIGWDGSGQNTGVSDKGKQQIDLTKIPVEIPKVWPKVLCDSTTQARFDNYFRCPKRTLTQRAKKIIKWVRGTFHTSSDA